MPVLDAFCHVSADFLWSRCLATVCTVILTLHKTEKAISSIRFILDGTDTTNLAKLYQIHAILCDHTAEAYRMSLMREVGVEPKHRPTVRTAAGASSQSSASTATAVILPDDSDGGEDEQPARKKPRQPDTPPPPGWSSEAAMRQTMVVPPKPRWIRASSEEWADSFYNGELLWLDERMKR